MWIHRQATHARWWEINDSYRSLRTYKPGRPSAWGQASAGLPDDRWPEFLNWFARTAPGFGGNVNHSWHWLQELGFPLTRTLLTNAAASLHCVVPALGMPSDYVRVIDVVTINQVSLLPIIEIHIGPDGKMRYTLVGCPALGNIHTHVAAAGGEGSNIVLPLSLE